MKSNLDFFSLFPSLLVVTYALWTFLCVIFTGAVIFVKFKIAEKGGAQAGDDAYHRQGNEQENGNTVSNEV
jgi:hypothetical protein